MKTLNASNQGHDDTMLASSYSFLTGKLDAQIQIIELNLTNPDLVKDSLSKMKEILDVILRKDCVPEDNAISEKTENPKKSVKICIKNVTGKEDNYWLISELSKYAGIKEGHIIENAIFDSRNNCCSFTIGTCECVAWVGHTCEIIQE